MQFGMMPMMYSMIWIRAMRVKFLDAARSDLMACHRYYSELGGATLASRMLARIKKPIMALKDNPEIAPCCDVDLDIRRLVTAHGAFLVFYRIRVDVEIIHIRRSERLPLSESELRQRLN
jgi:plasmid stabilization system protein ParE